MRPSVYDPNSPNEEPVLLPEAPPINISHDIVVQPPLTRCGNGPGLIIFLPSPTALEPSQKPKVLDPEPVQKWAEEGFAVAAVTISEPQRSIADIIQQSCESLSALSQVVIKDKFAVIIYGDSFAPSIVSSIMQPSNSKWSIVCLAAYGYGPSMPLPLPALLHLHSGLKFECFGPGIATHNYKSASPYFVLPQTAYYEPRSASVAHSRTLTFLKSHLGGPIFDLEAIWDEHTYFEFEVRSVAKTMGTMVAEPYVNHVPTMTGGIGRLELTAFYRDHFIFSNPDDGELEIVSRTVGVDRVIDEFVYHVTHDRTIDWLLPSVPPSGNKLSIPMLAVVNFRGDRLYHERIWWDQATVLRQAGLLPTLLECSTPEGSLMLHLPVTGAESAAKLIDETSVESNAMLDAGWGKRAS